MQVPFSLWDSIRQYLIPYVEENLESLSAKEAEFVRAAELAKSLSLRAERLVPQFQSGETAPPPLSPNTGRAAVTTSATRWRPAESS